MSRGSPGLTNIIYCVDVAVFAAQAVLKRFDQIIEIRFLRVWCADHRCFPFFTPRRWDGDDKGNVF
uniref:Endodeoxyribonuclease RusA n=1 Tax=uncultured marine virus TaxID=186617 RepID=A0A0F7L0R8_9VIRU|nr:endodeoxyribonuclease RusA [uncultured marine virus]